MVGDDKEASAARGWDDPQLKGRFLRRKDEFEDFDEEEDDDDDDLSSGDEFDVDDEYGDDDDEDETGARRRNDCDEEAFEKVLEEYDDEQLGYIDADDEEALEGAIDLADGDSKLLNAAIEEFLSVNVPSSDYL